jgi:hypothetical protein
LGVGRQRSEARPCYQHARQPEAPLLAKDGGTGAKRSVGWFAFSPSHRESPTPHEIPVQSPPTLAPRLPAQGVVRLGGSQPWVFSSRPITGRHTPCAPCRRSHPCRRGPSPINVPQRFPKPSPCNPYQPQASPPGRRPSMPRRPCSRRALPCTTHAPRLAEGIGPSTPTRSHLPPSPTSPATLLSPETG